MRKSLQRGSFALSYLVGTILLCASLTWILSDYLPASAEQVQKVVSLADTSADAQAIVGAAFKMHPNPTQGQLRRIQAVVNELLVTETARRVTSDPSLQAPSVKDAEREGQEQARLTQVAAKPWSAMSNRERAEFFMAKGLVFGIVCAILGVALIGWRNLRNRAGN